MKRLKRLLEATPVDRQAEDRVWQVVRAAYAEREPARRRRPRYAVALAALAVAVAAAALSPPGRAVVDAVRRTIGVEHASPAIFRLPTAGRLLVSGDGGTWIVNADGSKRRLGDYREATWSPHGLYVVAASANELAAVEPDGTVRWSLARPQVAFPRWGGSRTDTRIAYLSRRDLHVVAGDGTGDRIVARATAVAPAWRPGAERVLTYVDATGRVVVRDTDRDRVLWRSHSFARPRLLRWEPKARALLLATAKRLVLFDGSSGAAHALPLGGVRAAAFSRTGRLAVVRNGTVLVFDGAEFRQRFVAPGRLSGLTWSPDGRWLATTLPAADQWIFVGRRVAAVSNIRRQLGAVSLDGWVSAP